MDRTRRIIAATGLLALAVGACSSPAAPSWKFAAAETGSAQPAASAAAAAPELATQDAISIEAFDLGFTPAAVQVKAAGTYPVTFANTGSTLHDVTFADGSNTAL